MKARLVVSPVEGPDAPKRTGQKALRTMAAPRARRGQLRTMATPREKATVTGVIASLTATGHPAREKRPLVRCTTDARHPFDPQQNSLVRMHGPYAVFRRTSSIQPPLEERTSLEKRRSSGERDAGGSGLARSAL